MFLSFQFLQPWSSQISAQRDTSIGQIENIFVKQRQTGFVDLLFLSPLKVGGFLIGHRS